MVDEVIINVPLLEIRNLNTGFTTLRDITLLEALRKKGYNVNSACGGLGICGLCRVKVLRGYLSSPTQSERDRLSQLLKDGWRLACQAYIRGDVEIELPSVERRVGKERRIRVFSVRHDLKILPLGVIGRNFPSDAETLVRRLEEEANLKGIHVSRDALMKLPRFILNNLALYAIVVGGEIIDFSDRMEAYGVAVDIGTTTVAASLVNLLNGAILGEASTLNRQVSYGADIISRISYCQKKTGGLRELQEAVLDTLNSLIRELVEKTGIKPENIYRVVVAGNTVMTHIFLGISPETLGLAPFEPVFREPIRVKAENLNIGVNPSALVETLPLLGGYIGGDVTGDSLASGILEENCALLIDIGTNGEILLKKGEKVYAVSVPAGPAFEGVGLESGMTALDGAIESIAIGKDLNIEYSVIGDTKPRGICGSGYIDLLSSLVDIGILERNGRFRNIASSRLRERNGIVEFVVETKNNAGIGRDIVLTQLDVRKLQLAIAAFKAATKILLREANALLKELERIYVAGDFGRHINSRNAVNIGLLPPVEQDRIVFIGNGSLTGAEIYMLSLEERRRALELYREIKVISLAGNIDFQETYIKLTNFNQDIN